MRDHQPTGGYPRIATIISADFDRFAQLRPGTSVAFEPVTVEHAHALLRSRQT
ncbi:KipI antagonist [compost metagenome]